MAFHLLPLLFKAGAAHTAVGAACAHGAAASSATLIKASAVKKLLETHECEKRQASNGQTIYITSGGQVFMVER